MIPITIPELGEEEAAAVREVLLSGWVTQGPQVEAFERAVADYCGTAEAVATTSCTTAMHLVWLALGIGPGDEVVCPSMSFIATANAIRHAGATPVFADVDPATFNLDPAAAERAITSRTRAILLVHQLGLPAALDAFLEIGRRRNLEIVEDAACALGSRYRGRPIGGHSRAACFSFHPRKVITTGEGGMITTNDAQLAARLRLLRHHGMNLSDRARHAARQVLIERYELPGYNYRMTDLQAAVGLVQLGRLAAILERRRALAARYDAALAGHPWLCPPHVPAEAWFNYQSYAVRLAGEAPVGRDALLQRLLDRGVSCRRGVMLAHAERAYADQRATQPLGQSEAASRQSLIVPLFPQMTIEAQDRVIAALCESAA